MWKQCLEPVQTSADEKRFLGRLMEMQMMSKALSPWIAEILENLNEKGMKTFEKVHDDGKKLQLCKKSKPRWSNVQVAWLISLWITSVKHVMKTLSSNHSNFMACLYRLSPNTNRESSCALTIHHEYTFPKHYYHFLRFALAYVSNNNLHLSRMSQISKGLLENASIGEENPPNQQKLIDVIDTNNSNHRTTIKQALNADDERLKRQDKLVQVRKQTREEQLKKRRKGCVEEKLNENAGDFRQDFPGFNSSAGKGAGALVSSARESASQLVDTLMKNGGQFPDSFLFAYNNNDDLVALLDAVVILRHLLTLEDTYIIDQVIKAQLVPRLVECLGCVASDQIQTEAAWAITNIAVGTPSQVKYLLTVHAIPSLMQLFKIQNMNLWEQATWALSNIAGEDSECRDAVLQAGGLMNVLQLCNTAVPTKLLEIAAWCLTNLSRGRPEVDFAVMRLALPTLENLLSCPNEEVINSACSALQYLTLDNSNQSVKLNYICTHCPNLFPKLVIVLSQVDNISDEDKRLQIESAIVRICGNFAAGSDAHTDLLVQLNVIPLLSNCLKHEHKAIRTQVCWCLSNVAAGTVAQIQSIIDQQIVPILSYISCNDHFLVAKEAVYTLANAFMHCTETQFNYLISQNLHRGVFTRVLSWKDCESISIVMQALRKILEQGRKLAILQQQEINPFTRDLEESKALDELEALQLRDDMPEIAEAASSLLQDFFDAEEEVPLQGEGFLNPSAFSNASNGSSGANGFAQMNANGNPTQFQFNSNNNNNNHDSTSFQFNPFQ